MSVRNIAIPIPEIGMVRVDMSGDGVTTSRLITPDDALYLSKSLQVAAARLLPPVPRTPRKAKP